MKIVAKFIHNLRRHLVLVRFAVKIVAAFLDGTLGIVQILHVCSYWIVEL